MRKGLFRTQAIEAQGQRLHGKVLIQPSIRTGLVGLLILLWVGLALGYLATAQYSRQATVTGWLEPPTGVVKVYADQPGSLIHSVQVKEGQQVVAGQPLITLHTQHPLQDGRIAQHILAGEYQQQLAMLTDQVDRVHTLYQQKRTHTEQRIARFEQDISRYTHLISLARLQFDLLDSRYQRLLPLAGAHIAHNEVEAVLVQRLTAQQTLAEKQQALAQVNQQLREQQEALATLPLNKHSELATLNRTISETRQQFTQLQSQSYRVIKAARDGIVSNLHVASGHTPAAGKPLLTLRPAEGGVRARFAIPVRAAGFIAKGQQVALRYDAYPFQKFGLHQAIVTTLSDAALLPAELNHSPLTLNEPVYLAEAQLEQQYLQAYGEAIQLKSGMTFTADITLSKRTLLEWLFEPLLTLTGRTHA